MRPVEYRLDESNNTFELSATLIGLPTVREQVRLKPGAFCKRCLRMALESKSNALFDRERTRRWYREEVKRREAAGDPFHCSDCHRPCDEWVSLPTRTLRSPLVAASLVSIRFFGTTTSRRRLAVLIPGLVRKRWSRHSKRLSARPATCSISLGRETYLPCNGQAKWSRLGRHHAPEKASHFRSRDLLRTDCFGGSALSLR
jgi:hypothetical protein